MKAKSLREVGDVVSSIAFTNWWEDLSRTRTAEDEAAVRFEELLAQATLMDFRSEIAQKSAIDTLYRAGACEDAAAKLLAEAMDLENRSFEVVATYEEHRYKVSEIWYRLGAAEKSMEEQRERVSMLTEGLADPADRERRRETDAESAAVEADLRKAERECRQLHDDYERETQRKLRLWDEVERMWASSAEMNLLVSEKRAEGRKIRRRAERVFKEAEERKARGKLMRVEAEEKRVERGEHAARLVKLLLDARERFGCAVGEDFLYWRQRDDQAGAFSLSLIDDSDSYNIEIKPLVIYRVERQRGVEFIEPACEGHPDEQSDQRFEEFFLKGRRRRQGKVDPDAAGR